MLFLFDYVTDRCKTQKICDESVDDCLAALKFILDWFVPRKRLKKLHDSLLANDNILFFDEDFSKVTFYANEMGIFGLDLDKINLNDDNNFYEDDPDTIIYLRCLALCNKFEKRKELMPVAWHLKDG